MAETADNSMFLEFLATRGPQVARAIFTGAETGEDLPEDVRLALAQIPSLDERDDRTRFTSLYTALERRPANLDERDIENLTRITTEFFAEAESPEDLETIARLFLISYGDENLEISEDNPALEQLQTPILKEMLAGLTRARIGSSDGSRIIDEEAEYTVNPETILNPTSDDFIEAFGDVLEIIQADMRQLGLLEELPNATDGRFLNSEEILSNDLREAAITAFLDTLGDSDEITAIKELEGAERFEALENYINGLDDTDANKAAYLTTLENLGSDATALQRVATLHEFSLLDQSEEGQANQINFLILQDIAQVGLDGAGDIGPEMERLLPAYLDYISQTSGPMAARAIALQGFMDALETFPDEIQNSIYAALEENAGPAPGVQLPPTPEELEEEELERERERELAETPPEVILRATVLENAARVLGVPPEVFGSIEDTRILSGVPYAHFDEGFERQMRQIFSENHIAMYGRPHPTSDDPNVRLGGNEALWQSWDVPEGAPEQINQFFAQLSEQDPVIRQIAAQTDNPVERFDLLSEYIENNRASMSDDENFINLESAYAALHANVRAGSHEYHIQPGTGDITNYRVSAYIVGSGETLQTTISPDNDRPLVMDGEFPDFNIFHPNAVTAELLTNLAQTQWNRHFEEHAGFYESRGIVIDQQPSVDDMNNILLPDLDSRIMAALRALHQEMEEEELRALHDDILNNNYTLDQLNERLRPESGSEDVVLQINSYIVLMNQIEGMRDLMSMRDYANYAATGLLPNGSQVNPLRIEQPWGNGPINNADIASFDWNNATEGRVFTPELFAAYNSALNNGGSVNAELFEHDNYAMAYIRDRGWLNEDGSGQLTHIQSSMVAREMMIRDAAIRHGVEPPDGVNPEARAAFIADYDAGYFNRIDIEIMMRSFDADGVGRAAERAEYNSVAWRDGSFNDPADEMHRNEAFHEMFAQDRVLTEADGTERIVQSTITQDDAVLMFWRDHRYREAFGYDETRYAWDYDRMIAEHGDETVRFRVGNEFIEMSFTDAIERIMENNTIYSRNQLGDVNNPIGNFHSREIRRYQAMYAQGEELAYKAEHGVVSLPETTTDATPRLNPEYDTITPMPEPVVEEEEVDVEPVSDELLLENCLEMTTPTPECIEIMSEGGITPDLPPALSR